MKKSKRQLEEPQAHPLDKDTRDELKFEVRKALLSRGAKQQNANRFEAEELTPRGTYMTFRYELCRFVIQKWVLNVKWSRKSKKTGNPVPYRWEPYAENWYQAIRILHSKRSNGRIIGLTRE